MYGNNSDSQDCLDESLSAAHSPDDDELMGSSQDFETHSVESVKSSDGDEEDESASAEERRDAAYNMAAECISDDSADEERGAEGLNEWNQNMRNYLGYFNGEGGGTRQSPQLPPPPNLNWFHEAKPDQAKEDEEENARILAAMMNSRRVQSALDWCAEQSQSDSTDSASSDELATKRVHIPLDPGPVLADLDMELHLQEVRQPFEQRICELENELENLSREAAMLGADSLTRQAAASLQPATEAARRERLRPRRNSRLEDAYTSYTQEAYRQYQKISAQAMAI